MTMSIQSMARAAQALIAARVPNSAVTVVINGQSGTGLRDTEQKDTNGTEMGELGVTTSRLLVSAADFTKPSRSGTILIDGDAAMITQVREDPVGACYMIEYQDQRDVSGL